MLLKIEDPIKCEQFISIFEHLRTFSQYLNIQLNETQFYIQGMDSSHAAMFEVLLHSSWFSAFERSTGDASLIGVCTGIFFKILNTREKHQTIQIEFKGDCDKINISFFGGEKNNEYTKHFEMPLVDVNSELFEIPEIEYQADMGFLTKSFASLVDQLALFGDTISIRANEEIVQIQSFGIEGKMSVDIPMDDLAEFAIAEGQELQLSYGIRYLHHMSLFHKLSKNIMLHVSEEFPMKVYYEIANTNNVSSYLQFYLAPKISNDED